MRKLQQLWGRLRRGVRCRWFGHEWGPWGWYADLTVPEVLEEGYQRKCKRCAEKLYRDVDWFFAPTRSEAPPQWTDLRDYGPESWS